MIASALGALAFALLEELAAAGTAEVSFAHAVLVVGLYVLAAAAAAALALERRDLTA